jgi:hypothetical protein
VNVQRTNLSPRSITSNPCDLSAEYEYTPIKRRHSSSKHAGAESQVQYMHNCKIGSHRSKIYI